jgi:toxin YoeB
MRDVIFKGDSFDDFTEWVAIDKKIFKKIAELIEEVRRIPFTGKGKPEPLKHSLKGYWSRRIDDANRSVYEVKNDIVIIISCRYHYSNE